MAAFVKPSWMRSSVNTHKFVYTTCRGDQSCEELEFPSDEMAMICARSLLSDEIISIGILRTAHGGTGRVGLWVWRHGQPEWKPDE